MLAFDINSPNANNDILLNNNNYCCLERYSYYKR